MTAFVIVYVRKGICVIGHSGEFIKLLKTTEISQRSLKFEKIE